MSETRVNRLKKLKKLDLFSDTTEIPTKVKKIRRKCPFPLLSGEQSTIPKTTQKSIIFKNMKAKGIRLPLLPGVQNMSAGKAA